MGLFNLLKKPNGRKLDPLRGLMNLGSFTVSGINPATKRKKQRSWLPHLPMMP